MENLNSIEVVFYLISCILFISMVVCFFIVVSDIRKIRNFIFEKFHTYKVEEKKNSHYDDVNHGDMNNPETLKDIIFKINQSS